MPKKNAYITKFLILSWIVIFILDTTIFTKAPSISNWFYNIFWNSHGKLNCLFALIPSHVVNNEYWRVISYAFIHFGILHIVCNISLVSFIGNILEPRISAVDFIVPVLLGDILAGIACMVFVNENAFITGSSPGIYALYGMFTSHLLLRKLKNTYMLKKVRNRFIFLLIAVNFLGFDTFLLHAVGFATGMLCGFIQAKCNHTFVEA